MAVAMFHVEHLLPLALMRAVEGARWPVAAIVVLALTNHVDRQSAFSLRLRARESHGRVQHVSGITLGSAAVGDLVESAGTGDSEDAGFSLARSRVSDRSLAAGAPAPGNTAVMVRSPRTGQSQTAASKQTLASSPDTRTPESTPRRQLAKRPAT
jgi:hypothetical protein